MMGTLEKTIKITISRDMMIEWHSLGYAERIVLMLAEIRSRCPSLPMQTQYDVADMMLYATSNDTPHSEETFTILIENEDDE